jgi:hypothetical protein
MSCVLTTMVVVAASQVTPVTTATTASTATTTAMTTLVGGTLLHFSITQAAGPRPMIRCLDSMLTACTLETRHWCENR